MPLTRRAYTRKVSEDCEVENNKENTETKENAVRRSKATALKKIETNRNEESPNFPSNDKKPPDTFDLLYSSPLKQEVNFKPLSFWSKKVKDLECKENVKKKKHQLYELSETDDSFTSQESKRVKKKRAIAGRQKNKRKKVNNLAYQFNIKNLVKNEQKNKRNENKEGSIVREKIILKRLNQQYVDTENKFSFNYVSSFGLTSTPGRSEKLNLVGGSNFNFLSPITSCQALPKVEKQNNTRNSIAVDENSKKPVSSAECSKNETLITPKRLRKRGGNEKVETKDLKRSPSIEKSARYVENVELNDQDSVPYLHHIADEEDEMNKTFLNISESETESGEISQYLDLKPSLVGCHVNDSNTSPEICKQLLDYLEILVSLRYLSLFMSDPSNFHHSAIELSGLHFNNSFAETPSQLLSRSLGYIPQTVDEDGNHYEYDVEQSNLDFNSDEVAIMDSSTSLCGSDRDAQNSDLNFSRGRFVNIQVRRRFNSFFNFRGSATEADLPRGRSSEKYVEQDSNDSVKYGTCLGFSCFDISDRVSLCVNETYRKNELSIEERKGISLETLDIGNNNCQVEKSLLSGDQLGTESQQKHWNHTVDNNIKAICNNKSVSNHYCSNQLRLLSPEANKELYLTVGNDSSVFNSSCKTIEDMEDINCSVCENHGAVKRGMSDAGEGSNGGGADQDEPCPSPEPEPDSFPSHHVPVLLKQYKKPVSKDLTKTRFSGDGSPVKIVRVMEGTICGNLTFGDDFDFPLPIFESTTCKTPVVKKNLNAEEPVTADVGDGDETRPEGESSQDKDGSADESNINEVTSLRLKPGKKWLRSALILKKAMNGTLAPHEASRKKGKMYQTFVEEVIRMQEDNSEGSRLSADFSTSGIDITRRFSNLPITKQSAANRTVKVMDQTAFDGVERSFRSIFIKSTSCEKLHSTVMDTTEAYNEGEVTVKEGTILSARDLVLARCQQKEPLPFEQLFNEKTLKNCKKVGEGAFGEVFTCSGNRVIKVIPIEGPDVVNGEPQKKFEEILTEMVIAMELSNLRYTENFRTNRFCELKKCWCVVGEYPKYLIDLWDEFDSVRGSENDSPVMFKSDQLYIVLEFGNGGQDLESFVFTSAEQCLSIFLQIAYSLVVAERVLEFEHRDMHWGNILIATTKEKYFKVLVDREEYKIPTKGVKVTIIDFTLSRISYDGCSIYNDLAEDPTLFMSQGDYQFEIYRMMKKEVMNDWSLFRPRTNLFWLHYVADKMITMVRFKRTDTKIHSVGLSRLADLKSSILKYSNSEEFLLNENLV